MSKEEFRSKVNDNVELQNIRKERIKLLIEYKNKLREYKHDPETNDVLYEVQKAQLTFEYQHYAIIPELNRREAEETWNILLPVNNTNSNNRTILKEKESHIDYTTQYIGLNKKVIRPRPPAQIEKTGFKDGLDFFGRMCDNFGIDITGFIDNLKIGGIGNRGFYRPYENFLALSGGSKQGAAETIIHELFHWLENKIKPSLQNGVHDFYVEITTNIKTGERNRRKRLPSGGKNAKKEYYRDGNIPVPHEGKQNYTLKDYAEYKKDTEIVIREDKRHEFGRYFYRNPRDLFENYEQFYNRIARILKNG